MVKVVGKKEEERCKEKKGEIEWSGGKRKGGRRRVEKKRFGKEEGRVK